MHVIIMLLGAIGFATFGVSAFSLFILWGYLLLRITGHYSASVEQDALAKKLAVLFGKLFGFSVVYYVVLVVVANVIGPRH
jgi:hypothetical protein